VVFVGFVALAVAMGIGRFAFTPVLPMMRHEGALSITGAAWLASANYAGYLAGALLPLLISIPTYRGICRGLVIVCLGTGAMGFVQTLSGWIVLRAVTGIGSAWVLIFVSAWCLDHLKQVGRLALNGAVFAGVGAGIVVTGLLCLAFMKAGMASSQAWVSLGSLAILSTALIWPVTRAIPKSERQRPSMRFWNLEGSRLILCYGAFGFSYIIPATFLPAMAQRIVSDPGVFGWMWPAFGAAAIVLTLLAAGTSKHLGNRQFWIACHLLMAVGVALPALWHHLCSIIVAALLVGSTFMVTSMVAVQEARQVAGRDPTPLISAMTTCFAVGQVIGPLLASKLPHLGDEFAGSLLLASFLLLLSACTLIRGGPAPLAKPPEKNTFGSPANPIDPQLHSPS
jgi:MFS family permease